MDELIDADGDLTIPDLLTTMADRCRDAAGADATGILVVSTSMQLEVVARSSHSAPFLAILEMQTRQGPCVDSYRMNQAVGAHDFARPDTTRRWPLFAPAAMTAGVGGADAVPMRMGHRVIGGLSLLRCESAPLDPETFSAVQTIADLTTLEMLRANAARGPGRDLEPTRQAARPQDPRQAASIADVVADGQYGSLNAGQRPGARTRRRRRPSTTT